MSHASRSFLRIPADGLSMLLSIFARRETLWAVTRVEIRKRYAGSILGLVWIPLQAALLLGVYSFVYGIVFAGGAIADYKGFGYVLFIFSGLAPYLALSDAISFGVGSVRQNITLVKNTVFPAELIPLKTALAAIVGHVGTLVVLLTLLLISGRAGIHWLYLPVPIVMVLCLSFGLVWFLSATAVLIPDLSQLVNLGLLLCLFLSPIAFTFDTIPVPAARALLYLNPLSYVIDEFRYALIGYRMLPWWTSFIALGGSFAALVLGAAYFKRLMPVLADLE
jgi:lipopolysaccharide transport system permease protein